jgi:tRNA 2-thiouridine synthesizing protein A
LTYPQIDARGRSCPEPVLLTKKALEKSPNGISVLVDNAVSRDNITRFGKNFGYQVSVEPDGSDFQITLNR